jgi:hypothetical protein
MDCYTMVQMSSVPKITFSLPSQNLCPWPRSIPMCKPIKVFDTHVDRFMTSHILLRAHRPLGRSSITSLQVWNI